MDGIAVRTSKLTKLFGASPAVDALDLEVRKGELFGLVGPDGGGKTTVMRLLAAIMRPSSGEAWVSGHSVIHEGEKIKEKIGYMSQKFGLYEDLTVMENIIFYADLYGVRGGERQKRIERLLGFSNLTPFTGRLAGNLSGGMKQKLGLACALIHTPEVMFLDEPTNGVDPVSRRDFWRILHDLLKEGVTIVISTSYLDEAERCTRIGLMHRGRVLTVDTPTEIRKSLGMVMVEVWTDDSRGAAAAIRQEEGIEGVSVYGDRLHVALRNRDVLGRVFEALQRNGLMVRDHREILPSIEDIFIFTAQRQ
ncbi:MAG TPA: ABC transporter ATP-binding protein [Thermodesulfovibrionales bacterium]|nr:ABC transporter ATP-binding protein [Thermodesulfovibrionales bacterium]